MIRPTEIPLLPHTLRWLADWQGKINQLPDYAAQVAEAQRLWPQKNREDNKTFAAVRETLRQMSGSLERCWYCGDSCADEVEHIFPKSIYPNRAFRWENYLYACGICNSEKRDNFCVFHPLDGSIIDVKRKPDDPVQPPADGEAVILNLRADDPHEYLILNLDDFRIHPLPTLTGLAFTRADYTVKVLKLNSRSGLRAARQNAYEGFIARLVEYQQRRRTGAPEVELQQKIRSLKDSPHRFVWERMKRQQLQREALISLFAETPEALHW